MNTNLTATQLSDMQEPSYVRSKIGEYKAAIHALQLQIESLQEICSHRNRLTSVSDYEMFGKTLYSKNYICQDCGKIWSEKRERNN